MWTKEWPTKPGYYWFFGWPFEREKGNRPAEIHFVELWKEGAFVTNGYFL